MTVTPVVTGVISTFHVRYVYSPNPVPLSIWNKPLHFHIWSTLTKFLILTAKYIVYDKIARVNSSAVYSDVRTKVLKVM